jgi:hypothetical protein
LDIQIKNLPPEVRQYLDKYSDPKWKIISDKIETINCVIVIPALAEYEFIRKLLLSLSDNEPTHFNNTLILFVINNLQKAPSEVKLQNLKTIQLIQNIIRKNKEDILINKIISSGLKIGFIDASTTGNEMPAKDGGVGFARKIGMDLALTLFNYNSTQKKIIASLDADCIVEKNYISEIQQNFNSQNLSAAFINFLHTPANDLNNNLAIICYEVFLRYYVLGLKYANSTFAFPTVGSTIVCDYKTYIKAEGMNKKKAAEDFYFMEKVAKITEIQKIDSTTVYPSARQSTRVPFGTGQRIIRFLSNIQNEYLVYSPQSFIILKKWLDVFNDHSVKSSEEYLEQAMKISTNLYNFLIEQKFQSNWERIKANFKYPETIQRQKFFWFDGFKTLKLIHYLRDNGITQTSMFASVDELLNLYNSSFIVGWKSNEVPAIDIQIKYLEILRKIT